MARKISLREFQEHLATRLGGGGSERAASLLGFQSGNERWLANLSDSGEIVSLPPLTPAPLTQPWFAGLANVRGVLYAVSDFSAFLGGEATPRNAQSRLLLVGARHGVNAALLVNRLLGLRNVDALTPAPAAGDAPAWAGEEFTDNEGQRWRRLDVARLLVDEQFLEIGA
ncbi:chemotaxis protein CheW [Rhodocyclus tenuis]|uniref:Twitching motility protein PilI n=1 Tax=Rhodocyclus tenuis TaxID=1066 RepID=A0A840G6L3_RHOTE|nr:chemotaxis protein CheW [Rhodocyclus tenuis]MBB4246358.1 twitching motility protein PilI [Rhodocyclus tenuis]